jgi:hypothetical protein
VISNTPGTVVTGKMAFINAGEGGSVILNVLANGGVNSKLNVKEPCNGGTVGVGVGDISSQGTYPFGF